MMSRTLDIRGALCCNWIFLQIMYSTRGVNISKKRIDDERSIYNLHLHAKPRVQTTSRQILWEMKDYQACKPWKMNTLDTLDLKVLAYLSRSSWDVVQGPYSTWVRGTSLYIDFDILLILTYSRACWLSNFHIIYVAKQGDLPMFHSKVDLLPV